MALFDTCVQDGVNHSTFPVSFLKADFRSVEFSKRAEILLFYMWIAESIYFLTVHILFSLGRAKVCRASIA